MKQRLPKREEIGNLRVLVLRDDGSWLAQGMEIDYASRGISLADVRSRFRRGLAIATFHHLRRFGKIDNLLQPAPKKMWRLLITGALQNSIQVVECRSLIATLPFERISFIQIMPWARTNTRHKRDGRPRG